MNTIDFEDVKKAVLDFFSLPCRIEIFKRKISKLIMRRDECPLHPGCSIYFDKMNSRKRIKFFKDPCWEMGPNCLCPVKMEEGCDNCIRKKINIPLC